jgi:hypothetical protein
MASDEGKFQGDPHAGGMAGDMAGQFGDPAEWPRAAEEMMAQRGGWWATLIAAAGSLATILGAVFLARRRSKRNRVMAAMPSSIADASEQVLRSREQLMHGLKSSGLKGNGGKSGRSPFRAILAIGAVALAGWGLRRTMAHEV